MTFAARSLSNKDLPVRYFGLNELARFSAPRSGSRRPDLTVRVLANSEGATQLCDRFVDRLGGRAHLCAINRSETVSYGGY